MQDLPWIQDCLEHLRALPFVRAVRFQKTTPGPGQTDGVTRLKTPTQEYVLEAVVANILPLTRELAELILIRATRFPGRPPWILLARHVGRDLARHLADQDVNFVDQAGNFRIRIEDKYFGQTEGRPQKAAPARGRGMATAGYKVLFTILARPALLKAPIRTLAHAAGVGKTVAAERVKQLREEHLIAITRGRPVILNPEELLDRWLVGYKTHVRPKLLIGLYRTRDRTPIDLEARIETELGDTMTWAWGGAAAAWRLDEYHRGETTVLHVDTAAPDLPRRLGALPAGDGPLVILRAPGPLAFEGEKPRTVHPLLIYTELVAEGAARASEAAEQIRKRYLQANV